MMIAESQLIDAHISMKKELFWRRFRIEDALNILEKHKLFQKPPGVLTKCRIEDCLDRIIAYTQECEDLRNNATKEKLDFLSTEGLDLCKLTDSIEQQFMAIYSPLTGVRPIPLVNTSATPPPLQQDANTPEDRLVLPQVGARPLKSNEYTLYTPASARARARLVQIQAKVHKENSVGNRHAYGPPEPTDSDGAEEQNDHVEPDEQQDAKSSADEPAQEQQHEDVAQESEDAPAEEKLTPEQSTAEEHDGDESDASAKHFF